MPVSHSLRRERALAGGIQRRCSTSLLAQHTLHELPSPFDVRV